jgi:ADP-ribosyl-[dinitrogen reductase] hydrolase
MRVREMIELIDRYRGCLLGLACGDAVGTTVEFSPRGSFEPVTDMVGGGPFHLAPGQWTDDTSMALCLATSLVQCGGEGASAPNGRVSSDHRADRPMVVLRAMYLMVV